MPNPVLHRLLETSGALADLLVLASNNTGPTAASDLDIADQKIADLLTLIGSAGSFVAIIFTLVLYGHYGHLHSLANHLFVWGVLGIDLFAAVMYFVCIFFVEDQETGTFTQSQCQGCGFLEQVHSMAEPMFSFLFWAQIFCLINRVDAYFFRSGRNLAITCGTVMLFSIFSASYVLFEGWYQQEKQAWCWIRKDKFALRVLFCWLWLCLSFAAMTVALVIPLCSDRLNAMQRRLLVRRGSLAVVWFAVNGLNLLARYFESDSLAILQAAFEPANGVGNVIAFLYSERMMTIRALGLAPDAEPRYGFTAAMRYIPDKVNDNYPLL